MVGGRLESNIKGEEMNRNGKGFALWTYLCITVLFVLLLIQTDRGLKETRKRLAYSPSWKYGQIDLMFNSRMDNRVAHVSKDLEQYLGWIFISEEVGGLHITDTFSGYKNCICIKGDPWNRKSRKIYATFISQKALKENFSLVLREN